MSDFYEKYPHIYSKVTTLWGTAECRKYLLELIADGRNGVRQGFSPEHAKEIILLLNKHDKTFPDLDDTYHIVKETFYSVTPKYIEPKKEGGGYFWYLVVLVLCLSAYAYHVKSLH